MIKRLTFGLTLITAITIAQPQEGNSTRQTAEEFGSIYSIVTEAPKYRTGNSDLMKFMGEEVTPIVGKYDREGGSMTTRLAMDLVIDNKGKVIDVTFPKNELTEFCRAEIKKKLFTMNGWTAGKMEGKSVCSHLVVFISCFKWG
jgi:hypothetical protein